MNKEEYMRRKALFERHNDNPQGVPGVKRNFVRPANIRRVYRGPLTSHVVKAPVEERNYVIRPRVKAPELEKGGGFYCPTKNSGYYRPKIDLLDRPLVDNYDENAGYHRGY